MSNRNKSKGTKFEREIADYFEGNWTDRAEFIDRRVLSGGKDKGDLANVRLGEHRLVVECKNVARTDLAGWVTEAQVEAGNDSALAGVVVHKRRGKGEARDQYVTLTLHDFILIVHMAKMMGRAQCE